jgi:hypothetical protein
MEEVHESGVTSLTTALDQFFVQSDKKGATDETDVTRTGSRDFMAALDQLLVQSLMIMGESRGEAQGHCVSPRDEGLPQILDDLAHEVVDGCATLISTLAPALQHKVEARPARPPV